MASKDSLIDFLVFAGNLIRITRILEKVEKSLAFMDNVFRMLEPFLNSVRKLLDISILDTVWQFPVRRQQIDRTGDCGEQGGTPHGRRLQCNNALSF